MHVAAPPLAQRLVERGPQRAGAVVEPAGHLHRRRQIVAIPLIARDDLERFATLLDRLGMPPDALQVRCQVAAPPSTRDSSESCLRRA